VSASMDSSSPSATPERVTVTGPITWAHAVDPALR
jgi:hypothetical protein